MSEGGRVMAEKKKTKKKKSEQEKRNELRTEYNRRQLKGGKDPIRGLYLEGIDATPEFGRLASRPEGVYISDYAEWDSKGKPYPARIMKVRDSKSKDKEKKAKGGYVKKYANGGGVRKARR